MYKHKTKLWLASLLKSACKYSFGSTDLFSVKSHGDLSIDIFFAEDVGGSGMYDPRRFQRFNKRPA